MSLISVIIPTCNRLETLRLTLEALQPGRQVDPPQAYEIWVTDDGNDGKTREWLQSAFPEVHWVKGPGKGPAANRNHGAAQARGQLLAFCDDDCVPSDDWLNQLHLAWSNGAQVIEGAVVPVGSMEQDGVECPVNLDGGHFWSANVAVDRDLFQSVGGFDEFFLSAAYEDQDLYQRLRKVAKVHWCPDCRVEHPVRLYSLRKRLARLPFAMSMYAHYLAKHEPGEITRGLASRWFRCCWRQRSRLVQALLKGRPKNFCWHFLSAVYLPFVLHRAIRVYQSQALQTS